MTTPPSHTVLLHADAKRMLAAIADRRQQALLLKRAEGLAREPEKLGKPLSGDLAGYRVQEETVVVLVVALSIREEDSRRGVYAQAQPRQPLGLLGAPEGEP